MTAIDLSSVAGLTAMVLMTLNVLLGLSGSRRAAALDRRQKTIICPRLSHWFPRIACELGQLIFLTAWKMAGDIRSS